MTKVFKKESEVEWENHFMVDGAKIKWLYTREKDESPITVMMVFLQKGVTLPDHRHPDQPDLIYPLKGKATMFIEGEGEFPLVPGTVVQVKVGVVVLMVPVGPLAAGATRKVSSVLQRVVVELMTAPAHQTQLSPSVNACAGVYEVPLKLVIVVCLPMT